MDKPPRFTATINQRTRLMMTLACILLAGILLSGIYLSIVAGKIAQSETRQQGELLGQQTVTMIKPALMAGDSVSLNFVLSQLVKQPHVAAIVLTDPKERLLGRAGDIKQDNLIQQDVLIRQQDETLAILELYLNPQASKTALNSLLIQAVILALITAIITLTGCWFSLDSRTQKAAENTPAQDPSQPTWQQSKSAADTDDIDTTAEQFHDTHPEQLVDLLRPDNDAPHMPGFAPFSDHKVRDESALLLTEANEDTVVEETDLALQPRKKTPNPLFENSQHEIQLDLYAFEQELELIVAAEEAGYLLYLDLASGHSDNLHREELQELQTYYYRMLDMVIAIYQGESTRADNGDLQLAFLKPHKDDSHGINAICASQLFNRLYKLFNQQRIRSFKPVLNLHMALVRGHYKKLPRMQEEARYLTHSTDSNELITHTALSEAPDLKVSLLAGADIIRAEEDKVLVRSVNDNYQKLLDKQARHLLSKLFP
ncbi:hypothetical protein [Amphritea sp.]|uniref:hypothetical protein n=1 Tax=Amphritea sp. TaxID=1872502 RepID=UPI003D108E35